SLGIGAICLAYNSILISELYKHYYKFRNDCVFSGALAEEGSLVPLDEESLRIKLKTAFFSEYGKFIIPEDNIVKAKELLSDLNAKYPERNLQLIPVKNFEIVFKNLDIVERYELKLSQKVKANYKKYQTGVNWTIGIAGILIILFFLINYLIPHLDRNPISTDFINGKYIAYNKYNIKIWERQIGGYLANHQLNEEGKNNFLKRTITVKDIDRDEKNEILVLNNYFFEPSPNGKNIVYCFNSDNNLRWKFEAKNEKVHYSDDYDGPFVFSDIFTADIDGDGYFEIIANGHINTVFPNKIYVLDYNGKEISSYWHAGYISHFRDYDIDSDGAKEITAAGVTNKKGYRCGCLIVFDPEFISGNSFDTDPVRDGKKGLEKYYIIFPKTFMTIFNPSNMNDALEITISENKMLVTVSDGPIFQNPIDNAFLLYEFDNSLRVTNIIMGNQFQKLYEIYVKEKKIQPIDDMKSYLDSLKNEVRYWDGDRFVKNPAINKYYLQAKTSQKQ
ncbi:MAG: VCBS repeat-containing protein, partial [Ignavibacteria bacterium]|nr:VCBS repeat-containing protein [Ignavibacteria bacterium]